MASIEGHFERAEPAFSIMDFITNAWEDEGKGEDKEEGGVGCVQ